MKNPNKLTFDEIALLSYGIVIGISISAMAILFYDLVTNYPGK